MALVKVKTRLKQAGGVLAHVAVFLFGWKGYLVATLAAGAAGFAVSWHIRDWMAEQAARRAVAHATAVVQRQERVTAAASAAGAAAIAQVDQNTRQILVEVPRHVTPAADAACPVPRSFVRLHDAAAAGVLPVVPDGAGEPDDAPSGVALSAVASTVAGNYGDCLANAEQLKALQGWVAGQGSLY